MEPRPCGRIAASLAELEGSKALRLVAEAVENGIQPQALVGELAAGLRVVGERFESGEYFLSELLVASRIMQQAQEQLSPLLLQSAAPEVLGTVVIGTVQGDLHDIGKNLVRDLLRSSGFRVVDLGVDVPVERFVSQVAEVSPDIVGLSSLLTTTVDGLQRTVLALRSVERAERPKIMVGGGAINREVAADLGADGYASDAWQALRKARELIGIS